ncbi:xylan O-acetyltransferase 1-like [Typha angustifolia]|uniref:xylan O-acetyltransferase 1-like n=1 Tax=Typha angustifolia TaxID=59011 RepID=UPI003C2D6DF6
MNPPRRKIPFGLADLLAAKQAGKLPIVAVVLCAFLFAVIIYSEDIKSLAELSFVRLKSNDLFSRDLSNPSPNSELSNEEEIEKRKKDVMFVDVPASCDLSQGAWVFDNVSNPLYRERECKLLTSQVTCQKNGRADDMYQKWRWQPKDCSLPKFDARLFLERLRGKRFMFVGDSLNRNQWESMVCMLQSELSRRKKRITKEGNRVIFHAEEYRATLEFYWAPFLVESNSDDPEIHTILHRIIKPESITGHAVHWKGVDFLVFNTYIWWMNTAKMRVRRPTAKDWSEYDEIIRIEAYERVLRTWSNWIGENVDPMKTSVFFMSISPLHINPEAWGNHEGIKCAKETLPVLNYKDPLELWTDKKMFNLAANVTRSMSAVPVTFIDITKMSEYRKDAHTSVYTIRQGKLLTPEQKADPAKYADCIHWCLPGLPDTWNLFLYSRILSKP